MNLPPAKSSTENAVKSDAVFILKNEPRREKTCLRGFRPGKNQTDLLNYR